MEYNGYKIEGDGMFGYSHIKPLGKGSVPLPLRGTYTTQTFAQKAIDFHVSTNKKAVNNGKAKISE